jgi:hypothetical protein
MASDRGHLDVMCQLLDEGADTHAKDKVSTVGAVRVGCSYCNLPAALLPGGVAASGSRVGSRLFIGHLIADR